jgi:DNA polymerase-3 subunit delta
MEDPAWKPDKRLKSYKELAKYAYFAHFAPATNEELAGFIHRCFADRGHTIDRAEIEYLAFRCTNLMGGMMNEIEKISAYAKNRAITRADIDAVATPAVEARVFEMCDELTAGRTGRALTLLADLETARESAIAVTAVISMQFRRLYAARLAMEARADRSEIMRVTGVKYPYHLSRLLDSARGTELPFLRRALLACMETDAELKSSKADDFALLRMLIMKCDVMVKEKCYA